MGKLDANPNQLVVEDNDLAGVVISLGRAHVPQWPQVGMSAPVWLRVANSAEQALKPTFLDPLYKMPGLKALGVVVDADQVFSSRWAKISAFANAKFPGQVPAACPPGGLILSNGPIRFGAWIMPNNASPGMLEDLCQTMIPPGSNPLWNYAQSATQVAQQHGASYKAVHTGKAHIRSWLAWCDPPGEQIGMAISQRTLNAHAAAVVPFVTWLRDLYQI